MSDIQIFIRDKDNEGEWKDIDEGLLDLSSHDAKVRTDGYNKAIDEFSERLKQKNKVFDISNRMIDELAEQLKAGVKYEM